MRAKARARERERWDTLKNVSSCAQRRGVHSKPGVCVDLGEYWYEFELDRDVISCKRSHAQGAWQALRLDHRHLVALIVKRRVDKEPCDVVLDKLRDRTNCCRHNG